MTLLGEVLSQTEYYAENRAMLDQAILLLKPTGLFIKALARDKTCDTLFVPTAQTNAVSFIPHLLA